MLPRYVALFLLVALLGFCTPTAGADAESAADDEALRTAHLPTDGAGLLAFFRKRTLNEETQVQIKEMIAQLGQRVVRAARGGQAQLVSLGPGASALCARRRIKRTSRSAGERDGRCPTSGATGTRRCWRRRPACWAGAAPPETTEVLLAYLPCAEDTGVEEEVCLALASAALRNGKADPVLVRATFG